MRPGVLRRFSLPGVAACPCDSGFSFGSQSTFDRGARRLVWLHDNLSVADWIGLIALAGISAEIGLVMLLYLDLAYTEWTQSGRMRNLTDLRDAIYHGAVKRVRPKAMTTAVIIAGLLSIMWSHGSGADVMKRIATPMIGSVVTSVIMELVVFTAVYYPWRAHSLANHWDAAAGNHRK